MRFLVLFLTLMVVAASASWLFLKLLKVEPLSRNIVFVTSKKDGQSGTIWLAQFDGKKGKVGLFQFKPEFKVNVVGGYGEYELGAVWDLLRLEKKDQVFVRAAYGHALGVGVDGVYVFRPKEKAVDQWQVLRLLVGHRETWHLALWFKDVEAQNFSSLVLGEMKDWQKLLASHAFGKIDDSCAVAIINTTQRSGVAANLTAVLENSGVAVVRSGNSIWDDEQTALFVAAGESQLKCLEVQARLQSLSPLVLIPRPEQNKVDQYRASMVLLIGEDLAKILEK